MVSNFAYFRAPQAHLLDPEESDATPAESGLARQQQGSNIFVDNDPLRDYQSVAMRDARAIAQQAEALSGAAGHLCSALDELATGDCAWFTAAVLEILAAIDEQIALLGDFGDRAAS